MMIAMTRIAKIGRGIRRARNAKKLTQDELAAATGIDRSYLSELENGKKNISIDVFMRLSDSLDVKPYKLLEACLE